MRISPSLPGILGAALLSAGVLTAHAAGNVFYDPANAASSSGKTVGYELYKTIGCPGRGLLDAPCPTTPAPVDSDRDGIVDALDKCPTVFAKTADGCPLSVAAEPAAVKKLVLEGVNFDNDESLLRLDAYPILDRVVRSLRDWGDVKVEIAGHTDSVGTDKNNLALSQSRAETVRAYLINKGIAADRLIAKGYGEAQPVADNETEAGRFQNRRVELVPLK